MKNFDRRNFPSSYAHEFIPCTLHKYLLESWIFILLHNTNYNRFHVWRVLVNSFTTLIQRASFYPFFYSRYFYQIATFPNISHWLLLFMIISQTWIISTDFLLYSEITILFLHITLVCKQKEVYVKSSNMKSPYE